MKKSYVIINTIVAVITVVWNSIAGARGVNGKTVGELSDEYNNLFTPADWAFSIWGIIFIGLLLHVFYQIKKVYIDKKDDQFVEMIGPWFTLANIMNSLWLVAWLMEYTGLSVIIMLILLISLLLIIVRLGLNTSKRNTAFQVFIHWPIGLYAGWISVATIANISAYLSKSNVSVGLSEINWTIIMIIIATILNIYMLIKRKMIPFGLIGVWALVAIYDRHNGSIVELQWTSLAAAILIAIIIFYTAFAGAFKKA